MDLTKLDMYALLIMLLDVTWCQQCVLCSLMIPFRFTAEEKAKRPQQCYMPFGFGPRSCIGMRLALLESKMALIAILRRFTFTRAPDTEVGRRTCYICIGYSNKGGQPLWTIFQCVCYSEVRTSGL